MPFKPFPYQQECLVNLAKARRHHQHSGLVVMASGLGKTVTAALDAKRFLTAHGGRLLYLCHQNDILHQARTTFEAILGNSYSYGFYHGLERTPRRVDCLFASFQTMRSVRQDFRRKEFAYIVVDESHHGPAPTYQPTIKYFRPQFLLGLTATPERTDLQDIAQAYGETVFSLPLEEALARGYLTTVDYRLMTDELRDLDVLDTPVGRMSVRLLNKKLFIPRRDEEIARLIRTYAGEQVRPRVMVFCPSISYTTRLAAHLPDCLPIHSHLSDRDQRSRLDLFRQGLVNTVLTVDKFNEGIDIPDANVVVFLRSTASRIVFYQQLGRGLRKAPDKSKVLVLDFVANCERLEMINTLWTDVDRRRPSGPREPSEPMPPISVDIGHVQFTEVAKKVLDVLAAIRGGYTREMLVAQMLKLTKLLGHPPTFHEFAAASKKGIAPSPATIRRVFGSYTAAMRAAGLTPRKYISREELTGILRQLYDEHRRRLTRRELIKAHKAGKCPGPGLFAKRFGSLKKAFAAAGIGYTRKILISQLKALAKKLHRTPNVEDVRTAGRAGICAPFTVFHQTFGGLVAAQRAAGLTVTTHSGFTCDDLIAQLQHLAKKLKRTPTTGDIRAGSRKGICASEGMFYKKFGTFRRALTEASLVRLDT